MEICNTHHCKMEEIFMSGYAIGEKVYKCQYFCPKCNPEIIDYNKKRTEIYKNLIKIK